MFHLSRGGFNRKNIQADAVSRSTRPGDPRQEAPSRGGFNRKNIQVDAVSRSTCPTAVRRYETGDARSADTSDSSSPFAPDIATCNSAIVHLADELQDG